MNKKTNLPEAKGMTYSGTGVSYADMDPFKILCQQRAAKTSMNAKRFGIYSAEWSRGESAFIAVSNPSSNGNFVFSHVEEGLGTKNLVADEMSKITGLSYYYKISQCTLAMIVNDMATLGFSPVTVAMHLAVASSDWFNDKIRVSALVNGWGDACDLAGCIWAGGETPTLRGIIVPDTALLSGSAVGIPVSNGKDIRAVRPQSIQSGDAIIFFESSGIHANGLTLARDIAAKLSSGYSTKVMHGRSYGDLLLAPTHIYCRCVEDLILAGVDVHYGVNITGHGWRKLMRAPQSLAYVIDKLPRQLPIFRFIQKKGPVVDEEAYGNLNMGAGFAVYVPERDVKKALAVCKGYPFRAYLAGHVEKSEQKKVVIRSKNIVFNADTLAVR